VFQNASTTPLKISEYVWMNAQTDISKILKQKNARLAKLIARFVQVQLHVLYGVTKNLA